MQKELPWQLLPGEGAFYGPKIEFSLKINKRRLIMKFRLISQCLVVWMHNMLLKMEVVKFR